MGLAANFDPLGIANAAKAFMFNKCDNLDFSKSGAGSAKA